MMFNPAAFMRAISTPAAEKAIAPATGRNTPVFVSR